MKKISLEKIMGAVNAYLEGAESIRDIAQRYNISKSVLHRWITRVNEHGLAAFKEKYTNYSVEFKMDVLNYIDLGASIDQAAAKFNISSYIVWKWKQLYETQGIDALQRKKKGRPSVKKELKKTKALELEGSEEALRAENEQLRMEVAYLKKLHALIQEKKKLPNKTKHK
ncbi:helix-turn-helix domain-containing protein [Robertmurraya sp. P23]|uniref:helix-turn-helix domain-containing protein n=1 Tax=Robertmurraya sp. P23 TaxID=3436931 RepID=UPI003D971A50